MFPHCVLESREAARRVIVSRKPNRRAIRHRDALHHHGFCALIEIERKLNRPGGANDFGRQKLTSRLHALFQHDLREPCFLGYWIIDNMPGDKTAGALLGLGNARFIESLECLTNRVTVYTKAPGQLTSRRQPPRHREFARSDFVQQRIVDLLP